MLRNNADARRCSYFELGLPVTGLVMNFKLMFQNFIMGLHFQLLPPPITTVSRSKPNLKVLLGKQALYFRSNL